MPLLMCPSCLEGIDTRKMDVWTRRDGTPIRLRTIDVSRNRRSLLQTALSVEAREYLGCAHGHEIPPDLLRDPTLQVALIGATMSMKSHFVGVTAMQPHVGGSVGDVTFGADLTPSMHTEATLEQEYLSRLRAGKTIGRTLPDPQGQHRIRSPIMHHVAWWSDKATVMGDNDGRFNLLLFDAPGERITGTRTQQMEVGRYLVNADMLVFFVDVATVPQLRAFLPPEAIDPEAPDFDPEIVPRTVEGILQHRRDGREQDPLKLGLQAFVVLSKADYLQRAVGDLGDLVSSAGQPLRELDGAANGLLARTIIERYMRRLRVVLLGNFRDPRYFLASALGSAPTGETFTNLDPWGCDLLMQAIVTARGGVDV